MLSGFLLTGLSAEAQTGDSLKTSRGKISVNIVKEVDGKTTKLDTTFDLKDEKSISEFMQRHHIEMKKEMPGGKDMRVMKFNVDDSNGEEREISISIPPGAPVPPPPPMPPSKGSVNFSDDEGVNYTIKIDGDELAEQIEDLEKMMEITYSNDGKVKKEIRRIEMRDDQGEKRRKPKKSKRRIIIIEEI